MLYFRFGVAGVVNSGNFLRRSNQALPNFLRNADIMRIISCVRSRNLDHIRPFTLE
jgi:hypothetical protein